LALQEAMEGAELVFHLASGSLPQSSNRDPQADVQVNLLGALKVFEAARQAQVQRLVMVSSGGTVYGVPQQVPIAEGHPTEPTCSYGISKLAIEKYVALYRQLHGLDGLVLRVANPYGERQRLDATQGVVPVFLGKALRGEPLQIWGDGSTVRDFLHISDVVTALLAAAHYQGEERLFNVGSGEGLSLNQLVELLRAELQRPLAVEYLPARGFDVPTNVLCIERARRCLGWNPKVTVSEGLHRLCASLND
jgi:UDP-glucose 4-epimerase